jgi:hypothetical protein
MEKGDWVWYRDRCWEVIGFGEVMTVNGHARTVHPALSLLTTPQHYLSLIREDEVIQLTRSVTKRELCHWIPVK